MGREPCQLGKPSWLSAGPAWQLCARSARMGRAGLVSSASSASPASPADLVLVQLGSFEPIQLVSVAPLAPVSTQHHHSRGIGRIPLIRQMPLRNASCNSVDGTWNILHCPGRRQWYDRPGPATEYSAACFRCAGKTGRF